MVKTKFMILLVSVFVLIALAELVVADANSTSCGTVNNGITLTANVSANADCFVLNASSVTIDCAGFMVSPALTTPNSRGVANNGFDNVVVKNCNFVYTSNTDRVIFFGGGTDNALIQNNTINGSTGNTVVGIDVNTSSSNVNITGNTITTVTTDSDGIFIRSPTNAYIENNIITTTGGGADGITIESATQVNRILNNTVTINDVSGTVTNGILLQNSLSTTVSGSNQINVNGNNTMGIRVTNSNSSVITSNIITIPGCPAGYAPTAMRFDASSTNNVVGTDMATQLDVLGNNLTLNCNGGNGILVTASNNVIKNSNIAGTGGNIFGIGLTTANNTNLTLNSITLTGAGTNCIQIATDSTNNQLTNNALTCMGAEIADAGGAHTNYLVYSNSNGQIAWTNAGFLSNLTLKGTGGIGLSVANIALNSNLAALNTSAFTMGNINSSANITINGLSFSDITAVIKDPLYRTSSGQVTGSDCLGSGCTQISYNSGTGTLIFNTTSFSSFTAQGNTPAVPEFSDYAIILIMIVTIGGFLVMKKKEK